MALSYDDGVPRHVRTVVAWWVAWWVVAWGLAACLPAPVLRDEGRREPFLRGIALGLFDGTPGAYEAHYDEELREIRATGATDVSLVITWVQDDVAAAEVRGAPGYTAPDALVRRMVRRARDLGLRVTLFPILRLLHRTPSEWRGVIHPTDPARWFASYGRRLDALARLGAEERVAWISVGSEIVSLQARKGDWEALIAATRAVFPGRLLYSANWDRVTDVPFWGALDAIGISAYWRVTPIGERATVRGAIAAWRPIRDELRALARALDRPIVFTEVGYPATAGAGAWPWNDFLVGSEGALDQEAQRRLFEAFAAVWSDEPVLAGAFVWLWLSPGGLLDRGHTLRRKPAGLVLHDWYRAARPPLGR